MEFLIRFTQSHETFRVPEIQALAIVEGINIEVVHYSPDHPFCIITAPSPAAAARLVQRSILTQSIHELWGRGKTQADLHASVRAHAHLWPGHEAAPFRFALDSFQGTRPPAARLALINSFAYLPLDGPIRLRDDPSAAAAAVPTQVFTIFEAWRHGAVPRGDPDPDAYCLGRHLGVGARHLPGEFDLKKRRYISTTSMDSELALVTANLALAAPGRLFYDPFVGTGSFPLAAARFGALVWGSDIDGRAMRGDEDAGPDPDRAAAAAAARRRRWQGKAAAGQRRSLRGNFEQYGLLGRLGDVFSADLTHAPVRRVPFGAMLPASSSDAGVAAPARPRGRVFDGIVCDPPYGVREGLRVLGFRDAAKSEYRVDGIGRFQDPDYVPPKKPYSFLAMLDDILDFATDTLVDDGRLSFWMPTANDEEMEIGVPTHPCMEEVVVCTQTFNKWQRRLITYRRIPDAEVDTAAMALRAETRSQVNGVTADELNPFRKGYFNKFQKEEAA